MSVNIRKHKKKLATVLILGVAAAISIPLLMPGKPEEDTVREREYTISIDPSEQVLLPGMKAYATIILKEKTDVLTLSNKAITLENGQQYVLVRDENGELVRKQIVTGFSDGRVSEILDGLSEQDVVIVQE